MPVKRNILFVTLTALILALGFYGADIIGRFFPNDTAENAVIARDISNNNAVYLKEDKQRFNPMSLLDRTSQPMMLEGAGELREITAAMITAMARQNDKSYIFQPVGKELTDALRFDKRGYIFVEKWQYLNSDRETRCLDCIVWTIDMSIAYIRFYSDNAQQLSGTEMNAGLDRLDKYSSEFYPYLSDQYYTIMDIKYDVKREYGLFDNHAAEEPSLTTWYGNLADPVRIDRGASILNGIIDKYETYRDVITENSGSENPLIPYWLAHYGFEDVFTSQGYAVVGGCKVCDLFLNQYGVWIKPSYSAKDGIIYQTLTAGTNEITVIYNVRDDMIEGFYFPRCSDDSYYISYEENGVG